MNTESTLQRLVRKALAPKRKRLNNDGTPRDLGVGVTGVVVTIIILGILAAVGGPPLWRVDLRRSVSSNGRKQRSPKPQQVVLQQRLTLSPDS